MTTVERGVAASTTIMQNWGSPVKDEFLNIMAKLGQEAGSGPPYSTTPEQLVQNLERLAETSLLQ